MCDHVYSFQISSRKSSPKNVSQRMVKGDCQETGLIKRERKINHTIIFWVLSLSFGVRLQRILASLKRQMKMKQIQNKAITAVIIVLLHNLLSFFINVSFMV